MEKKLKIRENFLYIAITHDFDDFFCQKMLKIRISQHLRFSQSLIIREILFTLFKNSAYHVLI